MKRTALGRNSPHVNGGADTPHEQTLTAATAAQGNTQNTANLPELRMTSDQAQTTFPDPPFPPGGTPPVPVTQPPQWQQSEPGMTAPVSLQATPFPANSGRLSPTALRATGAVEILIWKLTLEGRVDKAIAEGPEAWRRDYSVLQGVERISFGILTIDLLGKTWCPRLYNWRDVLLECCQMVGLQGLLMQTWSAGGPLISLLVKFGFNALLAEALNTETGRATLISPDKSGDTALHVAAQYSNFEAARLLLSFDDAQGTLRMRPGFNGMLPIHRAAYAEAPDIVALLLALKAVEQRLAAAGSSRRLPIHFAAMGCKLEKTRLPEGEVPFWVPILSCSGDVAVVRTLLEYCPHEQVTAQTMEGDIPLMLTGSPEVAALLLGVQSALQEQLKLRNSYGQSALDLAKAVGNTAIVSCIDPTMKVASPAPSFRSGRSSSSSASSTSSTSSTTGAAPSVLWSVDDMLHLAQLPPTATAGGLPGAEQEFEAFNL